MSKMVIFMRYVGHGVARENQSSLYACVLWGHSLALNDQRIIGSRDAMWFFGKSLGIKRKMDGV